MFKAFLALAAATLLSITVAASSLHENVFTMRSVAPDGSDASGGTAFVLNWEGRILVLTNSHVCTNDGQMDAKKALHTVSQGDITYTLTYVMDNRFYDICVLASSSITKRYKGLSLNTTPSLKIGTSLLSMGFPSARPPLMLSFGTLIGLLPRTKTEPPYYVTNSRTIPGQSGSPVVNPNDNSVVGIISQHFIGSNYGVLVGSDSIAKVLRSIRWPTR